MFGRLAAARTIQKPLAEIEPRFHHIASVSEAIARDFVSVVSAASRNEQDLERPKNRSAVDGGILSLIPFAVVAFVVVGVLYGAGFWMILTSRENIAAQRVGESKATVTSL
jgi:hypothetical protein